MNPIKSAQSKNIKSLFIHTLVLVLILLSFGLQAEGVSCLSIDCPSNLSLQSDANCQVVIADYTQAANVSNACQNNGAITVEQVPAPGSIIYNGVNTIILTATDELGNEASCFFDIEICDSTPPVIDDSGLPTYVYSCGEEPQTPPDLPVSDNCGPVADAAPILLSDSGVSCFADRVLQYQYAAEDECMNQANPVYFTITIPKDAGGPIIDPGTVADLTLSCTDQIPAAEVLNATDDCDPNFPLTVTASVQDNGDACTSDRIIIYTWSVSDQCGNASNTVSQSITIAADIEPPLFQNTPIDLTVSQNDLPSPSPLNWIDNCDGAGSSNAVVSSDGNFNPEIVTYEWSHTDACGNTALVIQELTVFPEGGENVWQGTLNENWIDSPSNWSLGRFPSPFDHVKIPNGTSVNVSNNTTAFANLLDVELGAVFNVETGAELFVQSN